MQQPNLDCSRENMGQNSSRAGGFVMAEHEGNVENSQALKHLGESQPLGLYLGWLLPAWRLSAESAEIAQLGKVLPELGKPMRNCYSLPGLHFTYGMYMHKRDGGVPEAIGHWDSVKAKPHKRVMPPDFVTMGRRAVDEGCTKAREFALYYKYMDIRCKDKNILRYGGKIPPGMTFGRPPRPSTPIFDIMQHRYKELWMEHQRARTVVQRGPVKKKTVFEREGREKKKSHQYRGKKASAANIG
ncbi:hypothetical protein IHE44_0007203 [Lamprotornis superbus]|uniref:Uncharacterized protein n=1 Tax=Lamprotornis superbus TaxID=245042 RepID=A0A835NU66_9PASS|nr:hypothetical protein IHE44_0007203 [Lamprotornis superbus]